LGAIAAQYNEGTRMNHRPREFMSPHTREIYDAINNNTPMTVLEAKHQQGATGGQSPAGAGDPLSDARSAIARGAPRDAVIKRLQGMGVNPAGL
jgi:hypothetical protein